MSRATTSVVCSLLSRGIQSSGRRAVERDVRGLLQCYDNLPGYGDSEKGITCGVIKGFKHFAKVFSLTILSALVLNQMASQDVIEELIPTRSGQNDTDPILAEIITKDGSSDYKASQAPNLDVDKLFEEIMLDMPNFSDSRPLTINSPQKKDDSTMRTTAPSSQSSSERNSSHFDKEIRKIRFLHCEIKNGDKRELQLRLRFEDKMDRELTSELKQDDEAESLAWDLVHNGLASEEDVDLIAKAILVELLTPFTQSVQ